MKRFFVPSREQLLEMQDIINSYGEGFNATDYMKMKVIEIIIHEGLKKNVSSEILNETYRYFREDPMITDVVCKLYPETIKSSNYARTDSSLLSYLLKRKPAIHNQGLEYVSSFDKDAANGFCMIGEVVSALSEELKQNPRYRFEYELDLSRQIEQRNPSEYSNIIGVQEETVLNSVFNTNLLKGQPHPLDSASESTITRLEQIEPYYCMITKDYGRLSGAIKDYCVGLGRNPYASATGEQITDPQNRRILKKIENYH